MDSYIRVSSRIKLGPVGEDYLVKTPPSAAQPQQATVVTDVAGSTRSCRIHVQLYIRGVEEDIKDVEDASAVDSWDKISYINQPVELHKEEGCSITLESAIKSLLLEIFEDKLSIRDDLPVQGDSEAGSGLGDEEIMGIVKKCSNRRDLQGSNHAHQNPRD